MGRLHLWCIAIIADLKQLVAQYMGLSAGFDKGFQRCGCNSRRTPGNGNRRGLTERRWKLIGVDMVPEIPNCCCWDHGIGFCLQCPMHGVEPPVEPGRPGCKDENPIRGKRKTGLTGCWAVKPMRLWRREKQVIALPSVSRSGLRKFRVRA